MRCILSVRLTGQPGIHLLRALRSRRPQCFAGREGLFALLRPCSDPLISFLWVPCTERPLSAATMSSVRRGGTPVVGVMEGAFPKCAAEGWGLRVDAKSVRSVRKHPQASASVRKRPRAKIVAKRRTVVAFGLALRLRVSKVSTVTGIAGVVVAKCRSVVTFGLAFGPRISKVSTVTGIAGVVGREMQNCRILSSLLDLRCIFASQKQQSQGSRSQNAELSSLLVSRLVLASQKQQSQGLRGPWSRNAELSYTVVAVGLAFGPRISKVSTVTRVAGVGEERGEQERRARRGERRAREKREERREERREGRRERREERGEEGGEQERRERREKRRERKGERSEDRRGKRREDDPGPKFPDWFRAWGVIILAMYVSVSAFGFVDPIRFLLSVPVPCIISGTFQGLRLCALCD